MIEKLRELNDKLIDINKSNEGALKRHSLIKKILDDDQCFFKMDIKYAYSILKDLGIAEDKVSKVYMSLIDVKNYKEEH